MTNNYEVALKATMQLNQEETETLANLLIKNLRRLRSIDASIAAKKFRLGDLVTFTHRGKHKNGTITSINRNTISVSVFTDGGGTEKWRVTPTVLTRVQDLVDNPV